MQSFPGLSGRSFHQLWLVRYLDTLEKPPPCLKGKRSGPGGEQWEGDQGHLSGGNNAGCALGVGSKALTLPAGGLRGLPASGK